jgi:hypothetical protein
MDELVGKAVGIGFPFIVLLTTMATTGLTGAAAITTALAMLGPAGMIGGIVLLGSLGLASDMLTRYGLDKLMIAIYTERVSQGELSENLCWELTKLPITHDLGQSLQEIIGGCLG